MKVKFKTLDGEEYQAEVLVEGTDHYLVLLDKEPCWINKDECEIVLNFELWYSLQMIV